MGVFDDIYRGNVWGFGSGHGSLPRVTKGYRSFLEMFIRENDIARVVEVGCGDWQFSRLIDWGGARYTGLDIVPSVIEDNRNRFSNPGVSFEVTQPGQTDLPAGDLLLIKDVLQHMNARAVLEFIRVVLPRYRYALITNCCEPRGDINIDVEEGGFRPLDLRARPFEVDGTVVFSFEGPKTFSRASRRFFPAWKKQVLLVAS